MSVNISKGKLQVFNPATGKEISVIPMTSSNELQIILQNAKEACDYNLSSLYYRKKLMTRFQKGIVNRMDEFIETICAETGKKSIEGLMEVFISFEHLKYATHHVYKALGKRSRRVGIMQIKKAWIEYFNRLFGAITVIIIFIMFFNYLTAINKSINPIFNNLFRIITF